MPNALGTLAAIPLRTATVNERLANATDKVAHAATPAQQRTAASNLSAAQFAKNANGVRSVSEVSNAVGDATTNNSGVPDVSEPGYASPSSVGNLYT